MKVGVSNIFKDLYGMAYFIVMVYQYIYGWYYRLHSLLYSNSFDFMGK